MRILLGLAVLVLLAPAPPAATAASGLRVAQPRVAPAPAPTAGGELRVTDTVRNHATRRSSAAHVRFLLSRDRAASRADITLGSRRVAPLRRGRTSRRSLLLRLPASVAPGRWHLLACLTRCRAAERPVVVRPPADPTAPFAEALDVAAAREQAGLEAQAAAEQRDPVLPVGRLDDCGDPTPAPDAPASAFTAMFASTTSGWTGGDGGFSVTLPDGRTAWLFGDSFLGGLTEGGGRDQPLPDIRNAVVVQGERCLTTLFRGTPATARSFETVDGDPTDRWLWPNQPIVHGDRIWVFLTRMTGAGWLTFEPDGSALAAYDRDLRLVALHDRVPTQPGLWWGAAVVDGDRHTYVFGIRQRSVRERDVLLLRTPLGRLDGRWEFWTGGGWGADLADAAPVLSEVDRLAAQISVVRDGDDWVLVSQGAFGRLDVNAWRAPAPQGPYGPPQRVTDLEPIPHGLPYNALVHPALASDAGLLLSYNVIPRSIEESQADASLYRPRFVRVALP